MQNAFRYETHIGSEGKLELKVPIAPGTPVEVLVLTPGVDDFQDLVGAASASLDFWDNPWDSEDWDNACMLA
jgi:hypothetical protein